MHPFLRFFLRFTSFFLLVFFAVQPFNWFCRVSEKCRPFYFTYYLPKTEGTQPFKVNFFIQSSRVDMQFYTDETSIVTFSGRKNLVTFHAKNTSTNTITFRPQLIVDDKIKPFLTRYDCPCNMEHKLRPNQEKILRMEFEFSKGITNERILNLKNENEGVFMLYKIDKDS